MEGQEMSSFLISDSAVSERELFSSERCQGWRGMRIIPAKLLRVERSIKKEEESPSQDLPAAV